MFSTNIDDDNNNNNNNNNVKKKKKKKTCFLSIKSACYNDF